MLRMQGYPHDLSMNSEELKHTTASYADEHEQNGVSSNTTNTSRIVAADAIQAEEVPTVPIDSMELVEALQPEVNVRSVDATYLPNLPTPLVVQTSEYRRGLGEWIQIWWDGIRPAYLRLSLLPILLGTALAWTHTVTNQSPLGQIHLKQFIGGIVIAFFIQVGGHLINDYYDYIRGIDTGNIFGSGDLIQQGYVKPTLVLKVGLVLLGLGAILGLIFSLGNSGLLYLFGLIIILGAYFYSAPPRPLSSIALGEIAGFFLFGPLLMLSAYMAQTGGTFPESAFVYSLPLGLLAMAVIHANNMRDSETDANARKQTIVNIIGINASRFVYLLLLIVVYGIIALLGIWHHAPHLILITFWTLPILIIVISGILRTKAPAGFHMVMHETLHVETYFVLLLIAGLVITALIPVLPHIPAHLLPF
jgi:1,4-dihydroxy-2-naphthoate polyprenyltransferase